MPWLIWHIKACPHIAEYPLGKKPKNYTKRDELHSSLWWKQESYQAPKGSVGNRYRKCILIDGTKEEARTSLEVRPVLMILCWKQHKKNAMKTVLRRDQNLKSGTRRVKKEKF